MKRTKIKGTPAQHERGSSQLTDPDFFSMPFLPESPTVPTIGASLQANNTMAPSPNSLMRDEFPLRSDCARLLSVTSTIPPAFPTPRSVAELTNQMMIEHATMRKALPLSLIPAMPHHVTPPIFPCGNGRFILGGGSSSYSVPGSSDALFRPVPPTGSPHPPASGSFPIAALPKLLVDPTVFALLRQLSDRTPTDVLPSRHDGGGVLPSVYSSGTKL